MKLDTNNKLDFFLRSLGDSSACSYGRYGCENIKQVSEKSIKLYLCAKPHLA